MRKLSLTSLLLCMNFLVFAGIVEVRSPVLKFSIIDTLDDIYTANVVAPETWAEYYRTADGIAAEYYDYLLSSYRSFSEDMKADLATVFENVNSWKLMDIVKYLPDNASLERINRRVSSIMNFYPMKAAFALRRLLPAFYEQSFRDFFEKNAPVFEQIALELTQLAKEMEDPFSFIQKTSGIELGDYDCIFYFAFQRVGASGFRTEKKRISTIQSGVNTIQLLYRTPFHEYSHEFFQTFTLDRDFEILAEKMKADKAFYDFWDSRQYLKSNYSWRAFLEENAVEGFAKFVAFKFYGTEDPYFYQVYHYDVEFYNYLRDIDFDPGKITLKQATYDFCEKRFGE